MPLKLVSGHFEKTKKMSASKEIKRIYAYFCLFLPLTLYQMTFPLVSFLLFVNYNVPFQKKNDKKFQDGRHWEQNAPKVSKLTI